VDTILDALSDNGPIAKSMSGFRPRQQQQAMAVAIADAIQSRSVFVAEAGTGTGKTYAYLVPALLQDGKVIISTGTKTLQDQLFYRDLPLVQQALSTNAKVALLKGRSNYLCHYRLEQTEYAGRLDPLTSHQVNELRKWLARTHSGDVSECEQVPEDAIIWPQVTSTVDNCLGSECPQFKECFVVKARRAAQEADIVVINHHLFFIDLALKGEGFGEILPSADAIIFDEAHQVADVARMYFGESISSRQISELCKDAEAECHKNEADEQAVLQCAKKLDVAATEVKQSMGETGQRSAWEKLADKENVEKRLQALYEELILFIDALDSIRDSSTGLERCYQRSMDVKIKLKHFLQEQRIWGGHIKPGTTSDANTSPGNTDKKKDDWVNWYETYEKRFVLHSTPITVADIFQSHVELSNSAWIFTSATLSVGKRFEHFTRQLGLVDANTERWDSPFSYQDNTLLYVPEGLPMPNDPDYVQQVVNMAVPIIKEIGGRTFLLVTSNQALRQVKKMLRDKIIQPVLVQGELPKASLLEKFRDMGNAVLLGTYSFWEGVDVKGSALSCVIIDKLPFASPGDPVMQAQINAINDRQGNAFMELQIPQAVIRLKQGVGRLIRDEHDTGVLMICDPRLFSKSYGRIFLRSLPEMPLTRDFDQVAEFVEQSL